MTKNIDYNIEILKISNMISQLKDEPDLDYLKEYLDDKLALAVFYKSNPMIDFVSKHISEVGDSTKEVLEHPLVFKENEDNSRRMIYAIINKNLMQKNLHKLKVKTIHFINALFYFS